MANSSASYYFYYAKTLVKLKSFDAAEENYRKSISLEQDPKRMLQFASFLFETVSKHAEAIKMIKTILPLKKSAEAYMLLGEIYNSMSEYKKAEPAFKASLRLDRKNSTAWAYLGILQQYILKDYEKAEKSYLEGIKYGPDRAHLHQSLANLYHFQLHKPKEALTYYQKLSTLVPDNKISIINQLFITRDRFGKMKAALKIFNTHKEMLLLDKVQYNIQLAIFNLHRENIGNAKHNWREALINLRSVEESNIALVNIALAICKKLKFGQELLNIFVETGAKDRLRPLFEGLQTLVVGNTDYLQNVAIELRTPALEFYDKMNLYLSKE